MAETPGPLYDQASFSVLDEEDRVVVPEVDPFLRKRILGLIHAIIEHNKRYDPDRVRQDGDETISRVPADSRLMPPSPEYGSFGFVEVREGGLESTVTFLRETPFDDGSVEEDKATIGVGEDQPNVPITFSGSESDILLAGRPTFADNRLAFGIQDELQVILDELDTPAAAASSYDIAA